MCRAHHALYKHFIICITITKIQASPKALITSLVSTIITQLFLCIFRNPTRFASLLFILNCVCYGVENHHNAFSAWASRSSVVSPDGFIPDIGYVIDLQQPKRLLTGVTPLVSAEFIMMRKNNTIFGEAVEGCRRLDGGNAGWSIAAVTDAVLESYLSQYCVNSVAEIWIAGYLSSGSVGRDGNWSWAGDGRWAGIVFFQGFSCNTYCDWEYNSPNEQFPSIAVRITKQYGHWNDWHTSLGVDGMLCHRSACHIDVDCRHTIESLSGDDASRLQPYLPFLAHVAGYYPNCTCYFNTTFKGPGFPSSNPLSNTSFVFASQSISGTSTNHKSWSNSITANSLSITSTESLATSDQSSTRAVSITHSFQRIITDTGLTRTASSASQSKSLLSSVTHSTTSSASKTAALQLSSSQLSTSKTKMLSQTTPYVPTTSMSPIASKTNTFASTISLSEESSKSKQGKPGVAIPTPLEGVPAAVQRQAELVAGAVSVAGGMTAGPTAVQLSLAMAVVRMARCADDAGASDEQDSLSLLVHPLAFAVGGGKGALERGAVLGNCFLIPAAFFAIVQLCLAPLAQRLTRQPSIGPVLMSLGWPSVMVVPFAALAEGSGYAIAALVLEREGEARAGSTVLGVAGLVVVAAAAGVWLLVLVRWLPPLQLKSNRVGGVMWALTATASWEPRSCRHGTSEEGEEGLADRSERARIDICRQLDLSHCVGDRRVRGADWVAFVASFAVGAVEGVPGDYGGCKARVVAAALLVALSACCCMTATVPAELATSGLMSALLAVLTCLAVASVFGGGGGEALVSGDMLAGVGAATNVVGLATLPLGLVEGLVRFQMRRLQALRVGRARKEEGEGSSLDAELVERHSESSPQVGTSLAPPPPKQDDAPAMPEQWAAVLREVDMLVEERSHRWCAPADPIQIDI